MKGKRVGLWWRLLTTCILVSSEKAKAYIQRDCKKQKIICIYSRISIRFFLSGPNKL